MRTQLIKLKSGTEVIINYDSKRKCGFCGKEIFTAIKEASTYKIIKLELVGLAEWDLHKCEGNNL